MQYRALACDYDGTIATDGRVDEATLASLQRFARSGRQLLLVTGRELPDLKSTFPELAIFHYVVAENGGLLYVPSTEQEHPLAEGPPARFVQELIARGVGPISVGRSIVATWQPHEATVLATIKDLGLDLQVIFNKGAVMILPSGINKATGLAAALREMKLSRHNVVAVGDAAFQSKCLAAQNGMAIIAAQWRQSQSGALPSRTAVSCAVHGWIVHDSSILIRRLPSSLNHERVPGAPSSRVVHTGSRCA